LSLALRARPYCCRRRRRPKADPIFTSKPGAVSLVNSTDLSENTGASFEVDYDPGFNIGGAVGYAASIGFRGEVEVGYRINDTDEITIVNDGGFGVANGLGSLNGLALSLDGEVSALTALVNVYYDIDTGSPFTPFVGLGHAHISRRAKPSSPSRKGRGL
jgi:opacity protein-like surface antigen